MYRKPLFFYFSRFVNSFRLSNGYKRRSVFWAGPFRKLHLLDPLYKSVFIINVVHHAGAIFVIENSFYLILMDLFIKNLMIICVLLFLLHLKDLFLHYVKTVLQFALDRLIQV